jgi:hypothetical protein
MEGEAVGHNFERDTPRDHLCQVWTLAFLELCITSWHEQVTLSQDDDDDNDMTALYKSNTLLLAH